MQALVTSGLQSNVLLQEQIHSLGLEVSELHQQNSANLSKLHACQLLVKQQESVVGKLLESDSRLKAELVQAKLSHVELEKTIKLKVCDVCYGVCVLCATCDAHVCCVMCDL